MSSFVLFLALIVGVPALVIWLANRDRARARMWGNQPSQNSIMIGAEIDMPRILPVEPVMGPTVNGAPTDELSHNLVVEETISDAQALHAGLAK